MGEFAEEFDCLRHSLPYIDLEPNFELISQLEELNGSVMENPCIGLMSYSSGYCLPQHSEFMVPDADNLSSFSPVECQKPFVKLQTVAGPIEEQVHGGRKRKTMAIPDTSSRNCSELYSEAELKEVMNKKKNLQVSGNRMRSKSNPKEVDKPREVVHVRAGRGQATDSHSLAERERRKKINERMKRLQEQVPGCYKEMGTARMLDEIIRYVQSLQNQVEFLSMELSAASHSHDHRLGAEALATPQVGKTQEEAERVIREGYGECSSFHSPVPF